MNYINWKCDGINCEYNYSTTEPYVEAHFTGFIKNVGAFKSRSLTEIAHEIENDMNRANYARDYSMIQFNGRPGPIIDEVVHGYNPFADKLLADLRAERSKYASTKYIFKNGEGICIVPQITNVKFNPPATIVFWSDNTKTVVKAQDDEPFDPEKGLAMAMVKKYLGNKGNYFNEISKWTDKYEEEKKKKEKETEPIGKVIAKNLMDESFTFTAKLNDSDKIRSLLGLDNPGKYTLSFDTVKVESEPFKGVD